VNKIYHVVWDDEKECFVVVSELAAGHKKSGSAKLSLAIAGALLVGGISAPAMSAGVSVIRSGLDTLASYYSVNDGGVQGGNYLSDGATGVNALAAGVDASASGSSAVAIGTDATASGASSIAVGDGSVATGLLATGVGAGAQAVGDTGTAVGSTTSATGAGSTAVGFGANAAGSRTLASGYGASASGDSSTALGNSAKALAADGVAIGSKSMANTAAGIAGYVPTTATAAQAAAINATKSTLGAVSVGDAATNKFRQIVGVAAGTADSDAVNVAQLKSATADAVLYDNSAHDSITLGGPAYNPVSKTGGTKISNVANGVAPGDAVNKSQLDDLADTPLTFVGNTGSVQKKLGDTVSIQGKGTSSGTYAGDNLSTEVDANGVLQVQMTDRPVFTSVTTGNTTMDTNGLTIVGGPRITVGGIDAAGKKITNVAAGTASTDVVNVGQLSTAVDGAKSHYYSVNDSGTQGSNYDNDGATGAEALAAGVGAGAAGDLAVAMGTNASAAGTSSVAMGDGALSTGLMTTSVGAGAQAILDTATALGATTSAAGTGATAVGYGSNAAGVRALASGYSASASGDNSTALGSSAKAIAADGVAIGSKSLANTAAGIAGYVPPTATTAQAAAINATKSTLGAVSVGDAASKKFRQITGVAAGTADSDAVNVAQLKGATADAVLYDNSTHDSVTLGGPTYNPVTKTGGTRITNVANGVAPSDAVNVSQLTTTVEGAKTHYYSINDNGTQGDNYDNDGATGANAMAAGVGAKATGASSTAMGNNAQANNDNDVALGAGSVTAASHATSGVTLAGTDYQFAGANPTSVVSVGSQGNERQITNVAAGQLTADSTDAVNGSQLYATNQAVNGLSSTINNISNGGGIKYFHANSSLADSQAVGSNSIAVGPKAVSAGADSVAIGNGATASTDNSVALGANSTTGAVTGTAGATIAGDNYTFAGSNPTGTVSVGAVGQERTITNVAAGVLSSDSTDAVNGSQLHATNQAVDKLDGRVSNVENTVNNIAGDIGNISTGQAGMFQTSAEQKAPAPTPTGSNAAAGGAGAVASGDNSLALGNGSQASASNSVAIGNDSVADRTNAVSVGSAGNERQITNVAAGTQGTDAVNVSQLKSAQAGGVQYDTNSDGSTNYNSVTLNPSGGNATIHNVQAGTATSDAVNVGQLNNAMIDTKNWAKSYTDQQVSQMGKRAYAGTASALASAGIPQAYQPNQSVAGVGIGTYRGQSAISVGVSTISESGRYIFKASATGSQQDGFGANVGAGVAW
jgi:autotransporter adhesin